MLSDSNPQFAFCSQVSSSFHSSNLDHLEMVAQDSLKH